MGYNNNGIFSPLLARFTIGIQIWIPSGKPAIYFHDSPIKKHQKTVGEFPASYLWLAEGML